MSNIGSFRTVALAEGHAAVLATVLSISPKQREQAISAGSLVSAASLPATGKAAIIPIRGVLLDEWSGNGPKWGATGYNYIRSAVALARADSSVKAVVLDIDSPGGLVSGLAETCSVIERAGAEQTGKPIVAVIRSMGCSAAYALAASTDHLMASPSSEVGSIGARLVHVSMQGALEAAGVKVTEITSHAGKGLGSPYSDLSSAARAQLQASVDDSGSAFAQRVARRRNLPLAAVNALNAASLPVTSATGRQTAFAAGLIDGVVAADEALRIIGTLSRGALTKTGQTTHELMMTVVESISTRTARGQAAAVQSGSHILRRNHGWDRAYAKAAGRKPEDVNAVWDSAIAANNPGHDPSRSASSAAWDRVYDRLRPKK